MEEMICFLSNEFEDIPGIRFLKSDRSSWSLEEILNLYSKYKKDFIRYLIKNHEGEVLKYLCDFNYYSEDEVIKEIDELINTSNDKKDGQEIAIEMYSCFKAEKKWKEKAEKLIEKGSIFSTFNAILMYKNCGSSKEWVKKIVEKHNSGFCAYTLVKKHGFEPSWAEKIIKNEANIESVISMIEDGFWNDIEWVKNFIIKNKTLPYNIVKVFDKLNFNDNEIKTVKKIIKKNNYVEMAISLYMSQKNEENEKWLKEIIEKDNNPYFVCKMYEQEEFREWVIEFIEKFKSCEQNAVLNCKSYHGYNLFKNYNLPKEWMKRVIESDGCKHNIEEKESIVCVLYKEHGFELDWVKKQLNL